MLDGLLENLIIFYFTFWVYTFFLKIKKIFYQFFFRNRKMMNKITYNIIIYLILLFLKCYYFSTEGFRIYFPWVWSSKSTAWFCWSRHLHVIISYTSYFYVCYYLIYHYFFHVIILYESSNVLTKICLELIYTRRLNANDEAYFWLYVFLSHYFP